MNQGQGRHQVVDGVMLSLLLLRRMSHSVLKFSSST